MALLSLFGLAAGSSACGSPNFVGARHDAMRQSLQYRRGQFHNSLPRHESSTWAMFCEWAGGGGDHTSPDVPVPTQRRRAADFASAPASGLRVTWLGHSTALVEIDGHRVLTDPVWSNRASPWQCVGPKRFFDPPLPLDELPELDAVVISHDHFDHLDRATIEALAQRVPLWAVPLGVGAYLEEWGVPPERVVERDWWGELHVGALTLTATPARHFSGRSMTEVYLNETLWSGWAVAGPAHRVYFSGDTGLFPEMVDIGRRLGPFDLTLLEIGAYNDLWPDVHLGPEQAVQAHLMVRGTAMLPIHWGTFDMASHNWVEPAERIIEASREAKVSIALPRPGESVEPHALPPLARWWPERPWQSAEEAPVVSTGFDAAPLLPGAQNTAP